MGASRTAKDEKYPRGSRQAKSIMNTAICTLIIENSFILLNNFGRFAIWVAHKAAVSGSPRKGIQPSFGEAVD